MQFLVDVDAPVVVQRQGYGQTVQKTLLVPQLQFIEGRRPPFVPQRQIPMVLPVQKTIETPQLQSVRWSMPLLCRSCHARCRADRCSWFRHCRKLWRCRRCSSFAVVDVAVISQRKVPGFAGRCLRPVHRQDVGRTDVTCVLTQIGYVHAICFGGVTTLPVESSRAHHLCIMHPVAVLTQVPLLSAPSQPSQGAALEAAWCACHEPTHLVLGEVFLRGS